MCDSSALPNKQESDFLCSLVWRDTGWRISFVCGWTQNVSKDEVSQQVCDEAKSYIHVNDCESTDLIVFSTDRIKENYSDVIIGAIASQIASPTSVYPTVYSGANKQNIKGSASLAFVWGIHRDRWIPRTNGQYRGKCFHLMTSSWHCTL